MENQKWKNQYIMFDLKRLHQDIWYWDNTISYPQEFVDLINSIDSESNSNISTWSTWTASDDKDTIYGAVKDITSNLSESNFSNKKLYQQTLYIINSLKMAAEMCFERYLDGHNINKSNYIIDLSNLPIKRWNPGSYMGPHSDGNDSFPKLKFTTVTYLNDNYEGGEICFPEYGINLKPKAGSTIMFPSSVIHEVKEVIGGYRYMSTNSVNML